MYCNQRSQYIRPKSKKNSFRGNYSRKHGICMYHVIFDILHSNVENSITKVSLYYIIIDWGCLCLWQSERNQKYGWRYISWYNEAMYSTAWTFNYVKTTLTWSLTSISSLRYLINKRHGSRILEKTASWPKHTSYREVYFNEFVQNSLDCEMSMIIFDLHGGC